jgi:hypothetical protein
MRWRKVLMEGLEWVMGLSPVWWVAVSQLQPQHRSDPDFQFIDNLKPRHPYRGSGLVHWPVTAIAHPGCHATLISANRPTPELTAAMTLMAVVDPLQNSALKESLPLFLTLERASRFNIHSYSN